MAPDKRPDAQKSQTHDDDMQTTRNDLVARGVQATEVGATYGRGDFAFPEGRWLAVMEG